MNTSIAFDRESPYLIPSETVQERRIDFCVTPRIRIHTKATFSCHARSQSFDLWAIWRETEVKTGQITTVKMQHNVMQETYWWHQTPPDFQKLKTYPQSASKNFPDTQCSGLILKDVQIEGKDVKAKQRHLKRDAMNQHVKDILWLKFCDCTTFNTCGAGSTLNCFCAESTTINSHEILEETRVGITRNILKGIRIWCEFTILPFKINVWYYQMTRHIASIVNNIQA